jgi:tRNA A-37 threonylcarbamoyl transferase component Bud32
MMELSNLKLLAQGGQAEIYELDKDKVIRVLRNINDEENLKLEMSIMNSLKEKGKNVPKVYEYLKIEGRPSIIIERLYGDSMLDGIRKKPLQLLKQAEKLGKLHIEVAASAVGLDVVSINDRAAHLIPTSKKLDHELEKFVLDILSELPRGNDICHGDFHPGNIIITRGQYYVIDWFGVTSGEKLSDIAHTYLLLRNTPQIPGINSFQNFAIGCSGSIISSRYLKICKKLYPFDWSEFSKWMVVRAAERLCYGMPSEKETLMKFIKECKKAQVSGIKPSSWWKFI